MNIKNKIKIRTIALALPVAILLISTLSTFWNTANLKSAHITDALWTKSSKSQVFFPNIDGATGAITFCESEASGDTYVRTISKDGVGLGRFNADDRDIVCVFNGLQLTDEGIFYSFSSRDDVFGVSAYTITGKEVWYRELPNTCPSLGGSSDISLQLGYQDNLLALSNESICNDKDDYALTSLDLSTGKVIYSEKVWNQNTQGVKMMLKPYKYGSILLALNDQTISIKHINYTGDETNLNSYELDDNEEFMLDDSDITGFLNHTLHSPNGDLFIPILSSPGPDSTCKREKIINKILKFQKDNTAVTKEFDDEDCLAIDERLKTIHTTRDGGLVIVSNPDLSATGDEQTLDIVSLSSSLEVENKKSLESRTEGDYTILPATFGALVDASDQIILLELVNKSVDESNIRITILDKHTLEPKYEPIYIGNSLNLTLELLPLYFNIGLTKNLLYVGFQASDCSIVCQSSDYLSAFNLSLLPSYENYRSRLPIFSDPIPEEDYNYGDYSSPAPKLDYLALGDSFSSGEGHSNTSSSSHNYLRGTDGNKKPNYQNDLGIGSSNTAKEKCHISPRSYPFKIADSMNINNRFKNIACSGASSLDIVSSTMNYLGQFKQFKNPHNLDKYLDQILPHALDKYRPGRLPQIEFVEDKQAKVITVGIGGNDIGFAPVLESCVISFGYDCYQARPGAARQALGGAIRNEYYNLRKVFRELKNFSPNSKIYAVNYPHIIDIRSCFNSINAGAFSTAEKILFREATTYLNSIIADAAFDSGIGLIHLENSFDGNNLCSDKSSKYVNGITLGDDDNGIGNESFHPTPAGHAKIAQDIIRGKGNLINHNYCPYSFQLSCPTGDNIPRSVPSYFNADPGWFYWTYEMASENQAHKYNSNVIKVSDMNLKPGSTGRFELRSDPVNLGTFEVDDIGEIEVTIDIPNHIKAGYHTLLFYGKNMDDQDVVLYQIIKLLGNDDDRDENGIQDSDQICPLFVAPANKDEDHDGIDDGCDGYIGPESDLQSNNEDSAPTYLNNQNKHDKKKIVSSEEPENQVINEENTVNEQESSTSNLLNILLTIVLVIAAMIIAILIAMKIRSGRRAF